MNKKFEDYVVKKLAWIYETNDYERVYDMLMKNDEQFSHISQDAFGLEFLASRLALACRIWDNCCHENGVKEEVYEKLLLRRVMTSFQSPKFLDIAKAFSDYLYHDPEKPNPVITVMERFFQRLKLHSKVGKGKNEKMVSSFQTLVVLSESFRTSFENDFFEFANK